MTPELKTGSKPGSRLFLLGSVALALLVVVGGIGLRLFEARAAKAWSEARAIAAVRVVVPKASGDDDGLNLPGQLSAYNSAPIYPRVSGYVRAWQVDIGARVKAGQTLALIDTPELDQDIAKARADLASATASQNLSRLTANRWQALVQSDAVSRQDADEKSGDLEAKVAARTAASANLQRLLSLKAFARITAPFDGVVTARTLDIGDLVNAGAGSQAQALFTISNVAKIRVYVQAPQSVSAAIKPGLLANLTLPEFPDRVFSAKLITASGAIGADSGALLVELEADNADGALKPGAYAEVKLKLPTRKGGVHIPATTLIFRSGGAQVAVVDGANRVALRNIRIARDLGATLELASGVTAQDRIIDNPPDSLQAGDLVRVIHPEGGA